MLEQETEPPLCRPPRRASQAGLAFASCSDFITFSHIACTDSQSPFICEQKATAPCVTGGRKGSSAAPQISSSEGIFWWGGGPHSAPPSPQILPLAGLSDGRSLLSRGTSSWVSDAAESQAPFPTPAHETCRYFHVGDSRQGIKMIHH